MKSALLVLLASICFHAVAHEHVVAKSGLSNTPMNLWDPYVHQDEKGQHLFFGSLFCRQNNSFTLFYTPGKCDLKTLIFAIGYGFKSNDQDNFQFRATPVFLPAAKGQWDDNYVETPSLVETNGKFYLFYSAWNKSAFKRYQIGVASLDSLQNLIESEDVFSRISSAPLISPKYTGNEFDRENTQEPSALWNKDLNRFEVYYIGIRANKKNSNEPLLKDDALDEKVADIQEIGMGRKCFNPSMIEIFCGEKETNPLLTTRFDDFSRLDFINMPEVKFRDHQYWLFYSDLSSANEPNFSYGYKRVSLRTSLDGTNWSLPVTFQETKSLGVHSPTAIPTKTGWQLFTQMWWSEIEDQPGNCFRNSFRLINGKGCENTSLILFDE